MPFQPLELIRKLSADLQERRDAIESILDVLPIGIAIADDPLCRATRLNRALSRLIGLDASGHASLNDPPLVTMPPVSLRNGRPMTLEDRPMYQAASRAIEVSGVVVDVERGDGTRVTLMEYAAPLFNHDGSVRGAIGMFMDMTEQRRVEDDQRFLAHASAFLSSSLDYEATLKTLARLAVPMFGDYCAVDVLQEDGTFRRVDLVVDDPSRQELAQALKHYPPKLSTEGPAVRAIKSGAEDFMTKPVRSEELLESIRRAIARHDTERKRQQRVRDGRALLESLTPREREVFDLIVQGKMNKQAAHALGITERTVKAHRERVLSKLGARSVADLVSLAERLGIRADDPDAP